MSRPAGICRTRVRAATSRPPGRPVAPRLDDDDDYDYPRWEGTVGSVTPAEGKPPRRDIPPRRPIGFRPP